MALGKGVGFFPVAGIAVGVFAEFRSVGRGISVFRSL